MNIRKTAYGILKNVFIDGGYAGLLLRNKLNGLNEKDKSFITQIVYGTIRNYRLLNYQYRDLLSFKINKETEVLLNMSVYQLFMMDKVPQYAVVNEAVNLSKNKGLINALLRRVIERGFRQPEDLPIKYSVEEFIFNLWKAHYGEEVAIRICNNLLNEGKIYGRINTLKTSKEALMKDLRVTFIDDICFEYDGNLVNSEYFKKGEVIIQDYSSQQVCKYLDLKEHLKVLDLCAAPGSKTSQVAMMMNNMGMILAVDIHQHRIDLLKRLMLHLGIKNVECLTLDARNVDDGLRFDRILVDAPCSGLGVLKGKPDIKLRIKPEDIDEIVKVQQEILNSCVNKLNKGGILVYSTCTLNKKENEKQIEKFLKENTNFHLEEEKTFFPDEYDSDGFYMAKLIKKE